MKNIKEKVNLYFSSIVTVIISIPFFLNPSIGADWDSYALIGTYKNFMESGLYTPSRPPGFPLYELLIGLCVKISEFLFLSMEQTILFTQMILLLSLNFLIYKFFNKKKDSNYFIYLIAVFSPVFLLSGLTAIDYVLGSLLGFLSLYISMYSNNKQKEILVSFTLAMSIATRLSNIIFLIVVLILMRKELKKGFQIFVLSTFLFASFYLIFYLNLYSFYLENKIYNSWFDLMCIFNLTNTDHDFYNRIGRFTLKQIPYLGTVGMLIFIGSIRKLKINFKGNNLYFFLVFLFFQLSFLRLPTEEGHLLPAGDFDTQFTFAQALCEAARRASNVVVCISVPASIDAKGQLVETDHVGGEAGRAATNKLKAAVNRLKATFKMKKQRKIYLK